ncbi:U3 small nucleolar RNA-associated protein 13, putative [Plasmodium vivax]|uniref:U3 small nucleolar RNA-associated protein 13, putative n=1 Tax=Plasmodium vivax TaxID=5855 RepID=A0A1G4HBH9_PLAVI|nr:U3 small nucleolar RNA-associated protein 13, putative [Plasmodium vivax]
MSIVTNVEIEKKFFDFYEGDKNVFYSKEHELYLSLCGDNVYCFKINEWEGSSRSSSSFNIYNAMHPTCVLESSVDIDDVKETYHKRYLNRHCVSLFSSIRLLHYADGSVFLSTDDNKIHHYVLRLKDASTKGDEQHGDNEENGHPNGDLNGEGTESGDRNDIYLYDEAEEEDKGAYSYCYNWVHLKEKKIWKSQNVVVTCFGYSHEGGKQLLVGYINGLVNVYNLGSYKLKYSYRIHNSRITNLRMYRNFIISSDVTKNVFIYDFAKGEKVAACEDHMSGVVDFLFLAVQGGVAAEGKAVEEPAAEEAAAEEAAAEEAAAEEAAAEEAAAEEKLIGFITVGNDKIMNVWDLSLLNAEDEEEFNALKNQYNTKKKKKKSRNSGVVSLSPIKQIYLVNDINHALVIPSSIFKSKKSKLIIKDENVKWLILTHDEEGNFIFYNPLKAEIIFKFKENEALVNQSNVLKFILIKNKLHVFREDSSLLIYDLRVFKLVRNYTCRIEGIFEMLLLNSASRGEEACGDSPSGEDELALEDASHGSREQNQFAVLTGDNIIRILNFEENLIKQTLLIGHEDVVSCIKVSEKNQLLFSGSNDKSIFVWSLRSNRCIYILKDNLYTINSIDVNVKKFPRVVLVSVCEDSSLKLWNFTVNLDDIQGGKERKKRKLDDSFEAKETFQSNFTIYPHKVTINDVAISHSSKVVATCSKDKTVKLFEAANLKLMRTLEGHKKPVQNIQFSKTDHILYSNAYDGLRIWSLTTFECVKSIQSLDFNLTKVLILNDNCMINAFSNGNISIVNIKNCERVSTVNYHKDKIFCLQNCGNDTIASASLNGEFLFLKNVSAKVCTENMMQKRKHLFYENQLENLLSENKTNESLLLCLKLNKKFKFQTVIETYLNRYTFSILHLLKKFEYEYGIRKITQRGRDSSVSVSTEKGTKGGDSTNDTSNNGGADTHRGSHPNGTLQSNPFDDDLMAGSIHNYLENADVLQGYIYTELSKMVPSGSNESDGCEDGALQQNGGDEAGVGQTEGSRIHDEGGAPHRDDNFVLFLKRMKEKNEHSYFLYLNKLMEFISFFIVNHRYAYIANFLLNSVITYIDYADICKINDYKRFFEIYNSYAPRHKNRYLQSLQKSKCFELININYYKGDIKMVG